MGGVPILPVEINFGKLASKQLWKELTLVDWKVIFELVSECQMATDFGKVSRLGQSDHG